MCNIAFTHIGDLDQTAKVPDFFVQQLWPSQDGHTFLTAVTIIAKNQPFLRTNLDYEM